MNLDNNINRELEELKKTSPNAKPKGSLLVDYSKGKANIPEESNLLGSDSDLFASRHELRRASDVSIHFLLDDSDNEEDAKPAEVDKLKARRRRGNLVEGPITFSIRRDSVEKSQSNPSLINLVEVKKLNGSSRYGFKRPNMSMSNLSTSAATQSMSDTSCSSRRNFQWGINTSATQVSTPTPLQRSGSRVGLAPRTAAALRRKLDSENKLNQSWSHYANGSSTVLDMICTSMDNSSISHLSDSSHSRRNNRRRRRDRLNQSWSHHQQNYSGTGPSLGKPNPMPRAHSDASEKSQSRSQRQRSDRAVKLHESWKLQSSRKLVLEPIPSLKPILGLLPTTQPLLSEQTPIEAELFSLTPTDTDETLENNTSNVAFRHTRGSRLSQQQNVLDQNWANQSESSISLVPDATDPSPLDDFLSSLPKQTTEVRSHHASRVNRTSSNNIMTNATWGTKSWSVLPKSGGAAAAVPTRGRTPPPSSNRRGTTGQASALRSLSPKLLSSSSQALTRTSSHASLLHNNNNKDPRNTREGMPRRNRSQQLKRSKSQSRLKSPATSFHRSWTGESDGRNNTVEDEVFNSSSLFITGSRIRRHN